MVVITSLGHRVSSNSLPLPVAEYRSQLRRRRRGRRGACSGRDISWESSPSFPVNTSCKPWSYRTMCLCKGWGTPFTEVCPTGHCVCAKGGGHHSQRFLLQDNVCKGWGTPFTEVCPTGQCVCAKGGGTPFTEVCPTGHCVCAKGGGHHSQRFASKLDASLSPRPQNQPQYGLVSVSQATYTPDEVWGQN